MRKYHCHLEPDPHGHLRIWDDPIDGHKYSIGVDVAENKQRDISQNKLRRFQTAASEDRPDYSAACVIDMEYGQHVATWHGYIDPPEFARAVAALGFLYHGALLVVERNGPGLAVITTLVDAIRYRNLYRSKIVGKAEVDQYLTANYGWQTLQGTRPLLIARIHEVLNQEILFTRDEKVVGELRTMEFDERGVARGRGKNKDDLVIALGLALQGRYEALTGQLSTANVPEEVKNMDPESKRAYKHRKGMNARNRRRQNDMGASGSHRSGGGRYRTSRVERI